MNPSDRSDPDFELIARHLAGEMDASERAAFDRGELGELLAESRGDWEAAGVVGGYDVEAAWTRVQSRIRAEGNRVGVVDIGQARRKWSFGGGMMRAAAALVVIVGGTAVWFNQPFVAPVEPMVADTRPAQSTRLELPDGSIVVLGAASSVRARDGYGAGAREVELEGEAVFTVRHDEKRPFRVYASSALIQDLGTEFTVRAFEREPVRVAVSEGVVSVRRAAADTATAVVLRARDMAVLSDTGDLVVSRGVDVEEYRAWTQGVLVFRNTELRDAITELERWYGVDFRVTDEGLLARPITVDFANQPVDEMLKVLGTMVDVQFERRGQVVTVEAPVRTGMTSSSAVQVGSGA